ncbi:MAG: DUF6677 family protein [Thermoanaerobaculia bacterium]
MSRRALVAMALALVLPGAGHFFLGRRARGIAFFLIVATMFCVGLLVGGKLYELESGAFLNNFATFGAMGSGLLYLLGLLFAGSGDQLSITFEYGTAFVLSAGLMNLLLVLDAGDIAEGRKP